MNHSPSPTIGSLFSGYGGLDMAVESVTGATTSWVSDIDKGACKILAHRYPGIPNIGDITQVDWSQVEPVDIITGGSPCQDLSHAGRRGGMTEGTRSNLWVSMREAIAEIRPSLVVWENVRGAASAEATSDLEFCAGCMGEAWDSGPVLRALGRVVGDLADLGYVGRAWGIRAADVGSCHPRFRYFLAAHANGAGGGQWRFAAPRQASSGRPHSDDRRRGRAPLVLLPTPDTGESSNGHGRRGGKSGNGHQSGASLDQTVTLLPTPSAALGDGGQTSRSGARKDEKLLSGIAEEVTARLLPTPMVGSNSPAAHGQISGQFRDAMADAFANFAEYSEGVAQWASLTRPPPPPTEPSGRGGAHRLSPRFVEWMMGLPDGWITDVPGITRNEALRACGNGVVPQQAATAIRALLGAAEVAA